MASKLSPQLAETKFYQREMKIREKWKFFTLRPPARKPGTTLYIPYIYILIPAVIYQQGLLLAKPFCTTTQALGLICPMLRGVIGANRGGEKCDGGMQAPIYQQDST